MENINLIRKIAWSFHNTTGLDWDDLFSEAALAYCEGLKTYDEKKGKISTHMWHRITNHLNDYLKQEMRDNGHIDYVSDYDVDYPVSPQFFFEGLSNEAYEIAKLVLTCSKKFAVLTPEQADSRIYDVMENRGWSSEKIKRGLADLINACK